MPSESPDSAGNSSAPAQTVDPFATNMGTPDPVPLGLHTGLPRIPEYSLLQELGRGGMGVVYKAEHVPLRRIVALKMILGGAVASPEQIERFRREAEVVAKLQHTNIVQIYATGQHQDQLYLTLEYVAGGSLSAQLGDALSARRAAELLQVVALAVQHAHEHNIIHRDLKPANILMTEQGVPKVADFGLAKNLAENGEGTQSGSILGSPSYMAPEQARGNLSAIGPATDIYALGAILYHMLTARPPFAGGSVVETLEQVRTLDPPAPRMLQPKLPRDLETICLKCLEKEPGDRYPSAQALADDLRRFLDGESIQARPPSAMESMLRMMGRADALVPYSHLYKLFFAAAPLPFLLTSLTFWWFRDSPHFLHANVLVILVYTTAIYCLIARVFTPVSQTMPAAFRRHAYTVFWNSLLCMWLAWIIVAWFMPADRSDLLAIIFPIWVIILGTMYLACAANVGGFYIVGGVFLLTAVVLVPFLKWPYLVLAVSSGYSGNMVTQGLLLRLSHQRREF